MGTRATTYVEPSMCGLKKLMKKKDIKISCNDRLKYYELSLFFSTYYFENIHNTLYLNICKKMFPIKKYFAIKKSFNRKPTCMVSISSLIKNFYCYRVSQLTGFEPQDLIEKTLYQYIHASDILAMRYAHQICKCHASHPIKYNYNLVMFSSDV